MPTMTAEDPRSTIEAAVTSAAAGVLLAARYLAHYHLRQASDTAEAHEFFRALDSLVADVRQRGPVAALDSFTPLER